MKKVYSDTGIKGEDSVLSETGEELELLHKVRWMASPADRPNPSFLTPFSPLQPPLLLGEGTGRVKDGRTSGALQQRTSCLSHPTQRR